MLLIWIFILVKPFSNCFELHLINAATHCNLMLTPAVCSSLDPRHHGCVEISRAHQRPQARRHCPTSTAGGWVGECIKAFSHASCFNRKTRHTFHQVRWFKQQSLEDCSSQHWVKFEAELSQSQTGWKKRMGVEFQNISTPIAVPSIFSTGATFNWCAVTRPKTSICSLVVFLR